MDARRNNERGRVPPCPATGGNRPRTTLGTSVLDKTQEIEMELLLEGIFRRYGYDFRDYAQASIGRRILKFMAEECLQTLSGVQEKVLHDEAAMQRLVMTITVDVTAFFRDPSFYAVFREKVVPFLRTYPRIRLWHAGCSTGEEVYSMAILLTEEGLYSKSLIYATDMNRACVEKAKEGIYPLKPLKEFTRGYQLSGGRGSLSEYYTAKYDNAIFSKDLRQRITFSVHNLATDWSFNAFHVVLCRNVMIYFNRALQSRVHDLIHDSLGYLGILALGNKESLRFTPHEADYEPLDDKEKIFRKIT